MAFVNVTTGQDTNSTTTVPATAISHTAGNLLIAKVLGQEWGFSGGTCAISDTAGNTWNACTASIDAGGGAGVQMFYAYNCLGNASNVVTGTWTVAQRYKNIVVEQFSSMDTTSGVLIAQSAPTPVGSGTSITSGNLVTVTDSVLTAVANAVNDRTWTPDTGFTEDYDALIDTGLTSGHSQYKIQTGAGTYTVTATANAASNLSMAAAAFKAVAGAPAVIYAATGQAQRNRRSSCRYM